MIDFSALSNTHPLGRLLRAPLRLVPPDTTVRILQGPLRGAKWIAGSATSGCWLGTYELKKQRVFLRHLRPGSIVYDVGANVGFYTLLGAHGVGPTGQVIAFEPLPRNARLLSRHVEMNGYSNVRIVAKAVAAESGTALFSVASSPSQGRLGTSGDLAVETITLDALTSAGGLPRPDLMKIDVEGGELGVLRGAERLLRKHRPVILLATHGAEVRRECVGFLKERDYVLNALSGERVDETDELIAVPASKRTVS